MRGSEDLKATQEKFMRDLHFSGTVRGGLQRSGTYWDSEADPRRKAFLIELRCAMELLERAYHSRKVGSDAHMLKIEELIRWSRAHRSILKDKGELKFGVAQKLFNLHLKGLWCFGLLKHPPPHFPVDRIIQQRLHLHVNAWTLMTGKKGRDAYRSVINAASVIAKEHSLSLAELELRLFNGTLRLPKPSKLRKP